MLLLTKLGRPSQASIQVSLILYKNLQTKPSLARVGHKRQRVLPLPLDPPFRRLENTVITPHLGYVTLETYRIFFGDAVEDIRAFLSGTPTRVINAHRG